MLAHMVESHSSFLQTLTNASHLGIELQLYASKLELYQRFVYGSTKKIKNELVRGSNLTKYIGINSTQIIFVKWHLFISFFTTFKNIVGNKYRKLDALYIILFWKKKYYLNLIKQIQNHKSICFKSLEFIITIAYS